VPALEANTEYGQLAVAAAADALSSWLREHRTSQIPLFQPSTEFYDSCRGLGSGAGFCELSRLYFAKLTERYLNYFLDRAASASLPDLRRRAHFQREMRSHITEVSQHAFETAKITQSFAAGWFTKNTREGLPGAEQIAQFLSLAFGKLRDELRREEEKE
jgi:hypothetical protein